MQYRLQVNKFPRKRSKLLTKSISGFFFKQNHPRIRQIRIVEYK